MPGEPGANVDGEAVLAASRQVRLGIGVIGLGRLWEARHKPALARMADRFRDRRRLRPGGPPRRDRGPGLRLPRGRGGRGAGRPARRRRRLSAHAPVVRPARAGAAPSRRASRSIAPCRWRPSRDLLDRLDATLGDGRRDLHARVRPAVLPGLDPAPRAAGDGPRPAPAGHRPGPALRVRPLRPARPVDPDRPRAAAARPRQLPPRLVALRLRGRADGRPRERERRPAGARDGRPRRRDRSPSSSPAAGWRSGTCRRYHRGAWGESAKFLPPPGVQVFAERGAAWVEMPDRVVWADASGTHDERLPLEPTVAESLNAQFHRAVVGGKAVAPGWPDAVSAARLVLRLNREGTRRPV